MTMPHLMNCTHSPDGWCLDCVGELQYEFDHLNGFLDEALADRDYLKDLLKRLMSETRMYCRPGMVNYDVFPVFKEADDYFKPKQQGT